MTDEEIIQRYCDIAEMLGETFAPILEVVVHDLRKPDHSIIAIYNSHITGRSIGDPATNIGRQRVRGENIPDSCFNYATSSPFGGKLKTSTIAFRSENNKILGSLCLNLDLSFMSQAKTLLDSMMSIEHKSQLSGTEQFTTGVAQTDIKDAIEKIKVENNFQTRCIGPDENKVIIKSLLQDNYLSKKGAVTTIAKELSLTRPTVYKYIKEVGDSSG